MSLTDEKHHHPTSFSVTDILSPLDESAQAIAAASASANAAASANNNNNSSSKNQKEPYRATLFGNNSTNNNNVPLTIAKPSSPYRPTAYGSNENAVANGNYPSSSFASASAGTTATSTAATDFYSSTNPANWYGHASDPRMSKFRHSD